MFFAKVAKQKTFTSSPHTMFSAYREQLYIFWTICRVHQSCCAGPAMFNIFHATVIPAIALISLVGPMVSYVFVLVWASLPIIIAAMPVALFVRGMRDSTKEKAEDRV